MNEEKPMTEAEQIELALAEKERVRLKDHAKSQAELDEQKKD